MKTILQTVYNCTLTADGTEYSHINKGLLILLGIKNGDEKTDAELLVSKIASLRIFPDENEKMNLSCTDEKINGEFMIVSNFTLYGDCRKGRRPDFFASAPPQTARELYEYFIQLMKKTTSDSIIKTGVFGADMQITFTNDGPKTFIIDSDELKK